MHLTQDSTTRKQQITQDRLLSRRINLVNELQELIKFTTNYTSAKFKEERNWYVNQIKLIDQQLNKGGY